jgi:hypothetical protein
MYKQAATIKVEVSQHDSSSRMSAPDEQIFPHATGNAISTVEAHKEPQELIFYAGWVSCSRRLASPI